MATAPLIVTNAKRGWKALHRDRWEWQTDHLFRKNRVTRPRKHTPPAVNREASQDTIAINRRDPKDITSKETRLRLRNRIGVSFEIHAVALTDFHYAAS